MKKFWPFTYNFLLFASVASVAPFFVLYYLAMGFSGIQIGFLTGLPPLVTIISAPFWTGLADKTRRHRLLMSITLLAGIAVFFVFPFLTSFSMVLLNVILLNLFLAPLTPFADSATMFMLGDRKDLYSRIRLGGTLGYGLAAPLAGFLVEEHGMRITFWLCSVLFLVNLFISQKFVYGDFDHVPSSEINLRLFFLLNPDGSCF